MKIELTHVSRVVRGGHTVLRDVSFTIEPGEMVAIVGASGAGKSTLLDVLAGVRQPTQGSVRHDGGGVVRHVVGYVPQEDVVHREGSSSVGILVVFTTVFLLAAARVLSRKS